ncbi:hypothetical protein FB446DRAFT_794344 [Lentinula raphanica]|nr:hypothetical protein FB446DRAFT_794344 [Lentinula raphanica]
MAKLFPGFTLHAQKLQIVDFDLGLCLKVDGSRRAEAEEAGETFDDGEFEFEEVEKVIPPPITLDTSLPLSKSGPSLIPATLNMSRLQRKKYDKNRKSRSARQKNALKRKNEQGLKDHALRVAQHATPVELKGFSAADLPVASSGWAGNHRQKLPPGLQRVWKNLELLRSAQSLQLLPWDGRACVVLLDKKDRVVAVLGGIPPASAGTGWDENTTKLTEAMEACYRHSTFTKHQTGGRRGQFASRTVGYAYGNGRRMPLNYRVSGEANQAAVQELLENPAVRRVVGFTNSLFNAFAHKIYQEYEATNSELLSHHPHLRSNFPEKTVFAALTVNLGPRFFSPPHMDADNGAAGWCTDTPAGNYDPDIGGHLVLWDLGLVIRFPPGSSILFPSALITHSTLPIQENETRYAFIQYSSGGLFRWQANGFRSDQDVQATASWEEKERYKAERASHWKLALQKFTRWNDLVQGDWQGKRRTEAGLDEVSDLTDSDNEEKSNLTTPRKKVRRQP